MTGGLRLFPSNMQAHLFSKSRLAAIALMLDEGEKNAALSNKKKSMLLHKFKNTDTLVANRD
jgi:hypothetical protein